MKEFIVLYEVHDAGSMERQYTVWADTPEDAARMVITAHLPYLYGEQRRGATDRVVAVMERTGFLAPVSDVTPTFKKVSTPADAPRSLDHE